MSCAAAGRNRIEAVSSGELACWCGRGKWSSCFRTPRFGLLQCIACGCYRIDPPPLKQGTEAENFYTDYYSRVFAESKPIKCLEGSRTSGFWKVVARVPELAASGTAAADIGCGEGHLCAELRDAGWNHVIGVEVSRTRCARAKAFYPGIEFYDCPLEQTSVEENSLDLMVLDSVIEHLPDPVGFLRGLRRYLAPGGRLVIMTPNMESGHFRFLGRRWTGMLAPHAHIFLFSGTVLSHLLLQAGFSVLTYGSYHADPYTAGQWLRRLFSGDIKGALWRAHQEIGAFYGRWIGAGPMLYAVAMQCDKETGSSNAKKVLC